MLLDFFPLLCLYMSVTQILTMNSYLSMSQTIKTIMDTKHGVTLDDAHLHCCPDCSIHAGAGSSDVHNGHIDVALPYQERAQVLVTNNNNLRK